MKKLNPINSKTPPTLQRPVLASLKKNQEAESCDSPDVNAMLIAADEEVFGKLENFAIPLNIEKDKEAGTDSLLAHDVVNDGDSDNLSKKPNNVDQYSEACEQLDKDTLEISQVDIVKSNKQLTELNKALQSTMVSQVMDKAFFMSMIVRPKKRILTECEDEEMLFVAIENNDKVSVSMLLENRDQLLHMDKSGRTPLHLAVLFSDGSDMTIIRQLLLFHRNALESILLDDIALVINERNNCFGKIISSPYADETDIDACEVWFRKEILNLHRQLEITVECWWSQLMRSKDKEGRTPLHYAVGRSCNALMLETLFKTGRGVFNNKEVPVGESNRRGGLLKSTVANSSPGKSNQRCKLEQTQRKYILFRKGVLYSTHTGEELVNLGKSDKLSSQAQPKSSTTTFLSAKQQLGTIETTISTISKKLNRYVDVEGSNKNEVSGTVKQNNSSSISRVDYEIVVPWVVKNLLKRAFESTTASRNQNHTPAECLHRILKQTDELSSGVLTIPELVRLLSRLGISVTLDIVIELCRRYPADPEVALRKLSKLREKSAASFSRQFQLGSKQTRNHGRADSKSPRDQKGSKSGLDYDDDEEDFPLLRGNGDNSSRSVDSKYLADSKNDYSDDERDSPKRGLSDKLDPQAKVIADQYQSLCFLDNHEWDEHALDIGKLEGDIESGKAVKSVYLPVDPQQNKPLRKQAKMAAFDALNIDEELRELVMGNSDEENEDANQFVPFELSSSASTEMIERQSKDTINMRDGFGRSALMIACATGNADVVGRLLESGADIAIATPEGYTAVSLARGGRVKSIVQGALINWLNRHRSKGQVAINDATIVSSNEEANHMDINKCAMTRLSSQLPKLQENRWSYSRPPLSWTVNSGLPDSVAELLKVNNDPNVYDSLGRTPLHECMAQVSSCKNDEDVERITSIAEYLLNAGARVDTTTCSGRTPAHELFCKSQDDAAASSQVRVKNLSPTRNFNKPDGKLKALQENLTLRLFKCLLKANADLTILDRYGKSSIHYCVRQDLGDCLVAALLYSQDVATLRTTDQQTPLHTACFYGSEQCCRILFRWESDAPLGQSLNDLRDSNGKVPTQLLKQNLVSASMDTLWELCRRGDASRVNDILTSLKFSNQLLWESEEIEIIATADNTRSASSNSPVRSKHTSTNREEWLKENIDAKTRRYRWTCVHACIVGWAEREAGIRLNAREHINSKAAKSNSWTRNTDPNPLATTKGSINTSAQRALRIERRDGSSQLKGVKSNLDDSATQKNKHMSVYQPFLYRETLGTLLQSFAFVDGIDVNGRTPLMMAAACNLTDACTKLLAHGADVNATDLDGNTASHLAYAFGAMSSAAVLTNHSDYRECQNGFGDFPLDCAGMNSRFHSIAFSTKTQSRY